MRSLNELRIWQRFHWRLTVLYTGAVCILLMILGGVLYHFGVESEVDTLQAELRTAAITLSHNVDVEAVKAFETPKDTLRPAYKAQQQRFQDIAAQLAGVSTIYILRPSKTPGELIFVADYTANGSGARVGDAYDAREIPSLLRGLKAPSVDDAPIRDDFGLTLSGYAPLTDAAGVPFGLIGIDMDARRVDTVKDRVLVLMLSAFGVTLFFMAVLSLFVGRLLRRPLREVIEVADELAKGNLSERVGLQRSDEFGLLSEHVDRMAKGLQEREFIRETFGRYVSEDVARNLLATPDASRLGGEERRVTVLFSDLKGYSTLSELLSPPQIVRFINAYLGEMNTIIDEHNGCVIEYLGDAILAVFGAPNDLDEHPEAAVRCAIAMRNRCIALNDEWRDDGLSEMWTRHGIHEISARIGVHTGQVVAGNLGSRTRMKYAVIGDSVNVAARLEQLNKKLDTDILISATTLQRLPETLALTAVDKGLQPVKGRDQEVGVYAL